MANAGIRFFTTGYQETIRQIREVRAESQAMRSGFLRVGPDAEAGAHQAISAFGKVKMGVEGVFPAMSNLLVLGAKIATMFTAIGAAGATAGVAIGTKFVSGILTTREEFFKAEVALEGVLKNRQKVEQLVTFAAQFAAQYPAMFGDVIEMMQSMVMIPAVRPMFERMDLKSIKEMLLTVQGLQVMKPGYPMGGIMIALREALSGNLRSLEYRMDVPVRAIAASIGATVEQLRQSPELTLKALKAFVDASVGADTLERAAKTVTIQFGNLIDKYKMWMNTVGKSGMYDAVVEKLISLNVWWERFLNSGPMQTFGKGVNDFIINALNKIEQVSLKGVDFDKMGLLGGFAKMGENLIEAARDVAEKYSQTFMNGFKTAMGVLARAFEFAVVNIFFPIGKAIGLAIIEGLKEAIREHPVLSALVASLYLGAKGAALGGAVGGPLGAKIGLAAGVAGGVLGVGGLNLFGKETEGGQNRLKSLLDSVRGALGQFGEFMNGLFSNIRGTAREAKETVAPAGPPTEAEKRRRVKEMVEMGQRESDIRLQVKNLEQEINNLYAERMTNENLIFEKQEKLRQLRREAIDQLKQQGELVQALVSGLGRLADIRMDLRLSGIDRITKFYETFAKSPLAQRQMLPFQRIGLPGMTFGEAMQREPFGENAGIPRMSLMLERGLKQMLGAETLSPEGRLKIAERLLQMQEEQFKMATTPQAQMKQFEEAAAALDFVLDLEKQVADQRFEMQKEQIDLLKQQVDLMDNGNKILSDVRKIIDERLRPPGDQRGVRKESTLAEEIVDQRNILVQY